MSTAIEEPTIGHNQPDEYQAATARVEELVDTANKWIATVTEITQKDQAGRASDFRSQIRAMKKNLDAQRLDATAPLRLEVSTINGNYDGLTAYMDKAFDHLSALLKPWLDKVAAKQKEDERLAREAAERKRAEAAELQRIADRGEGSTIQHEIAADQAAKEAKEADKEAARMAKAKPQVRGDYATKATGFRGTWKAEITDIGAAFDYYREHEKVSALLVQLANADARAGRRRIPGFSIEEVKKVA